MTDQTTMWAVHVQGPDDVYPLSDRETADALALVLNRQFERIGGQIIKAVVIEWPHGYESWSAEKDQIRLEIIK